MNRVRPQLLRPGGATTSHRGFSLIELLLVVVILGILAAVVAPELSSGSATRALSAAEMLAADLQFAQADSIAHGDDPRVVGFASDGGSYWIAPASAPNTPITHPIGGGEYRITFGSGRASGLGGAAIGDLGLGGDRYVGFGALGQLDQSTTASVVIRCGKSTLTLEVDPATGEVTIR